MSIKATKRHLRALSLGVEGVTPQAKLVAAHLADAGSITGVEAEAVYRVRHLPRRIADLREFGANIVSEWRKDATGQRYVRYAVGPVGCLPQGGRAA